MWDASAVYIIQDSMYFGIDVKILANEQDWHERKFNESYFINMHPNTINAKQSVKFPDIFKNLAHISFRFVFLVFYVRYFNGVLFYSFRTCNIFATLTLIVVICVL